MRLNNLLNASIISWIVFTMAVLQAHLTAVTTQPPALMEAARNDNEYSFVEGGAGPASSNGRHVG